MSARSNLDDVHRLHTTAQLARIVGVPVSSVRAWVRRGLLRPTEPPHPGRRLATFDFAQVAVARAVARLTGRGVSPARLKRSLAALESWLGSEEASPGLLEVLDDSGRLAVRLDDGSLAEPSGQLCMDFDEPGSVSAPPVSFTLVREEADAAARGAPARDWFDQGLAAEADGDLERAVACYRRSLAEDGPSGETCFNLGNALYALDRKTEAADCLSQVTELDPQHVEAWNNLANVLSELGREQDAVRAYRRALAIDPHYADAHFNLAVTLASKDDVAGAKRHYLAYLAEDPSSPWAAEVHDRLARLDD